MVRVAGAVEGGGAVRGGGAVMDMGSVRKSELEGVLRVGEDG